MIIANVPCMTQSIATAAIGFFVAVLIMYFKGKKKDPITQEDVDRVMGDIQ